jgi:hypothetical protein
MSLDHLEVQAEPSKANLMPIYRYLLFEPSMKGHQPAVDQKETVRESFARTAKAVYEAKKDRR